MIEIMEFNHGTSPIWVRRWVEAQSWFNDFNNAYSTYVFDCSQDQQTFRQQFVEIAHSLGITAFKYENNCIIVMVPLTPETIMLMLKH